METIKLPRHPGFPFIERDIHQLCMKYNIRNYTINGDLSIDVDGNVYLSFSDLEFIPINFNYVSGDFACYQNELVSLEGTPKKIGGNFNFYQNKLVSLQGCPNEVNGGFSCDENNILSLEHLPVGIDYQSSLTRFKDNPIYSVVNTFIKNDNALELVEKFNDRSIIHSNSNVIYLNRLKGFVNDFDLEMPNMDEVRKHYEVI
jgi:hypothetical protein